MRNLHAALASLGLDGAVKVSSAHASSVLASSYPPSAGAFDAAQMDRAARGAGTPRRPGAPVEVFLFDLYDEDGKTGAEFERHFGIFRADGVKAYNINFA
ncbi:Glucan endo-1,3-beta-glucosidase, acidic isoform [Triticum urartu]|uniref:Glucan endo-1,3-beta-D-glucosidase n=2 Tax=Triticum TaxID=4564 RepID=A0A9R0TUG3_TRITD|nr:Glucan endo-1,3-beta-glucosidase, acidic isoform [Triticum urartu]VAI20284.1 unnamed protein product [Triticum turgidum subsp. durum]